MGTEVWLRNPADYIREVVEVGHLYVAFHRGYLYKRRLDAKKYLELQVPQPFEYRALVIGDQGTAEINRRSTLARPAAVYPTWVYGEEMELLEEMIFQPVGEDASICEDESTPREIRPVLGQEHRVVIEGMPSIATGLGKQFLRFLCNLQEEAPGCIIHVHGLYSYRAMFGVGLRSADVDARSSAAKGKIYYPNGRERPYESAKAQMQWVNLLGFKYADLKVPRNRCMYNIKSALWAAEHWDANVRFKSGGYHKPDTTSANPPPVETKKIDKGTNYATTTAPVPMDGDKFLCNMCSLKNNCKYYREGAVCSVPGTDGSRLSDMFRSRDGDKIIDALGSIVAKQSDRVERGLEDEEIDGELDPEVTKMMNSLFKNGVQLAKLLNPDLNGKGQSVTVAVGGGHVAGVFSPQQLTAKVVSELESQGIKREDITPQMIQNYLDPNGPNVLEASVVNGDDDAE